MPNEKSIKPGIVGFNDLVATSEGDLKLNFIESEEKPALLFEEDLDTALVLAFGKDDFQWPSIGIEQHKVIDAELEEAQLKDLSPRWLIETPIGPTFYITDFLGGRLSWEIDAFEVAKTDLGQLANQLIEELNDIDASDPEGNLGWQINVNAKNVVLHVNEKVQDSQKTWSVSFDHVEMRITGGYSMPHKDTGEKEMWHYTDDLQYKHGQVCAKLTENFDVIAKLMPVYERLRQFIGILYALDTIKQKGFRPNSHLQGHIKQKQFQFERRIEGKAPEYARSLPLVKKCVIGC